MKLIYFSKFDLRSPFLLKSHSMLSLIYYIGYAQPNKKIGIFFRLLYRMLKKVFFKSKGKFVYNNSENIIIEFNALNTQFHSVYLPQMKYYEPETSTLIDKIIDENDVFYDVGSNWGHYSLYVASNQKFKGRIYSFEPHPGNFTDLTRTVNQAKLESIVKCYPFALSNTNSETYMRLPDNLHSGLATLTNSKTDIRISQKKLDDLKLPSPNLIKLDIEGSELLMLQGALNVIEEHKPFIIFESHKNNIETYYPLEFLSSLGYYFYYPQFFKNQDNRLIFTGEQDSLPEDSDFFLGLWQFEITERLLLPSSINILDCHESMLYKLENRFENFHQKN